MLSFPFSQLSALQKVMPFVFVTEVALIPRSILGSVGFDSWSDQELHSKNKDIQRTSNISWKFAACEHKRP